MKTSGNKIVITISAMVLGLMLIVPVLPGSFFKSEADCCEELSDENQIELIDFSDSSKVFIGFSIGREISLSL